MADPNGPNGNVYVIDPVICPVSSAVATWYYADEAAMNVFTGIVDGVDPDAAAYAIGVARDSVYGGHWGVIPA